MREDIQYQILLYLSRHPDARDSAEGIMTWWLLPNIQVTLPEVEDVLTQLVRRHWVNQTGQGKVELFGLETAAMNEINDYLKREYRRG